ncbi:hypothetical protein VTL71DRAFT_12288 [Oculimacula yallundae]|uniref:FAD-binding domain-containing protein n=1 Tax=Oculimacula yallundae TaxID=86028 RepID=A0ABR4CM88_9HELO
MPGLKVIIIGGGLSGALLANGLINNDINVAIYERDIEETKREGYQIRLGEPSLTAFRACLPASQVSTIEQKFGVSSKSNKSQKSLIAPCIFSTKMKVILDLGKLPTYSVSTAISRIVLRNFLVDPVKEKGAIEFGKGFDHYEIIEDGEGCEKVRVHFSDGETEVCDILVGADGSASRINKQLGLNNIQEIKSHFVFVCKGSLPPKRVDQLPTRLREGPILLFHKGVSLYYALYMPPKHGSDKKLNVLDYDHTEASFYWSL